MTSHQDVAGLCERLRVNTCRYADETEEAAAKRRIATDLEAADRLESQAKALSEAGLVCTSVKQQNGQLRELLTAADARALAAEARLAKIDCIVHVPTPSGEKADHHFQRDFDAIRKLTAPFRAFTNAAKEKTDARSE